MIFLFQSWIESLKFFLPNNFITFFLVTIKSWLEFYKKFLTSSTLLFQFIFVSVLAYLSFIQGREFVSLFILTAFYAINYIIVLRPSVDIKDKSYYSFYWHKSLLLYVVLFLISLVFSLNNNLKLWYFLFYLLNPIIIFNFYFYLDSRTSIKADTVTNLNNLLKSFYRAILLTVYNLPFCFISYIVFTLIFMLLKFVIKLLVNNFNFYLAELTFLIVIIFIIFLPFYLAWFCNFYLKRVHDQFKLYFKSN